MEEMILREGADTIAGFFAEPVLGAGGVIPPPEGYFQALQPILQKYGIPLISDEVICGFGRTGHTWGCEAYGFVPDAIEFLHVDDLASAVEFLLKNYDAHSLAV